MNLATITNNQVLPFLIRMQPIVVLSGLCTFE